MPEPTWTDSISEWAIKNEVALVTTGKYKDLSEALNIDLAISIFYGKIIKQDFIDRCGDVINLHNSPLLNTEVSDQLGFKKQRRNTRRYCSQGDKGYR